MNGDKWSIAQWAAYGADVIVIICGLWLLSDVLGIPVVNVATGMLIILAVLWTVNMANDLAGATDNHPSSTPKREQSKRASEETDQLRTLNQLLTPIGIVLFASSILCYMASPTTVTLATFLMCGAVIVFGLQTIISIRQFIYHKD